MSITVPQDTQDFPRQISTLWPAGSGGALIGRIGETGGRFVVGERLNMQATQHGILYLRINDDILSDNDGWVAVRIDVTQTEDSLP